MINIFTNKIIFNVLAILALLPMRHSTQAATIPKAPSALTATAISATQINLAWTDNALDETGFELERSVDGLRFVKIADLPLNTKVFANTGLPASTKFWYRVLARNAAGKSAYSNIANATTFLVAPNAPTMLTAAATSISQINLSWTDRSTNESGFQLERSLDGTAFTKIADISPNVDQFQNTGLNPATTYFYRVRAINSAGASAYSNMASATTNNIPVPERPQQFSAVPIAPDVVQLRWAALSANSREVIIERAQGDANQFVQIGRVAANVLQFQDTDSLPLVDHYYRIAAVNTGGNSPYSLISIVLARSIITSVEPVNDQHLIYAFEKILFTELTRPVNAVLKIYDLRGVQRKEQNIQNTAQTDLSDFSDGIYIVRVVTDREVITRKILLY